MNGTEPVSQPSRQSGLEGPLSDQPQPVPTLPVEPGNQPLANSPTAGSQQSAQPHVTQDDSSVGQLGDLLKQNVSDKPSGFTRFVSSGFFFMIVGTIFLGFAYFTMGQTHSAMSFVFVVVGVAILLYGTGTQGIGEFDSSENAKTVAKYKVALAGGAGVIAFCVAGGIIAFSGDIKSAFQIEQRYVRFYIKGKGYQPDDIGRYIPDVRINGNPVPAFRRGDYIEVYAPYVPTRQPARFEINAKLHLIESLKNLVPAARGDFLVELNNDGTVVEGGHANGKYARGSSYDFPWYGIKQLIGLEDPTASLASGYVPK